MRQHVHGLHLRLDDEQHNRLLRFALESGLTLTAAVRLLLEGGLSRQPGGPGDQVLDGVVAQLRALSRLMTATLIASEEARLAVQSVIWSEDDERLVGLRARAASAARQQIAELESAEGEL